MARFIIPRDIYYGRGQLAQLRKLEGRRALIVGDGMSRESGFMQRAEGYLQGAGLNVRSFICARGGPTLTQAQAGARAMQEFKPDWIVAVGSEGSISAAKAMWIFYESPATTPDALAQNGALPKLRGLARLTAAPTGGGGEGALSGAAFLLDPTQGKRHLLLDPVLAPDIAIVDPDLAAVSPGPVLARGGMAALSQMLEALSRGAGSFAQPLALRAARDILAQLEAAVAGDVRARETLHEAQCMASLTFANAPMGLCQALAANTCAAFYKPLPTGIAESIFLPRALRWESGAKEMAAQVYTAAGSAGDPLPALCARLETLRGQTGLPASLQAFGIEEAEFLSKLPALSEQVAQDPVFSKAGRRPAPKEAENLLRGAYYGS